jgi:hypothetical protein
MKATRRIRKPLDGTSVAHLKATAPTTNRGKGHRRRRPPRDSSLIRLPQRRTSVSHLAANSPGTTI